jgi:hypothetical protein
MSRGSRNRYKAFGLSSVPTFTVVIHHTGHNQCTEEDCGNPSLDIDTDDIQMGSLFDVGHGSISERVGAPVRMTGAFHMKQLPHITDIQFVATILVGVHLQIFRGEVTFILLIHGDNYGKVTILTGKQFDQHSNGKVFGLVHRRISERVGW